MAWIRYAGLAFGVLCLTLSVQAVIYTHQFVIHVDGGHRVARDLATKHGFVYLGEVFSNYHHLQHNRIAKRSLEPSHEHHVRLEKEPNVRWFSQQTLKSRVKRDLTPAVTFNDPRWLSMWYLNRGGGLDMNVQPVWKMNITGRGVVVTILDDGLEKDHPDIVDNYDPQASWDVNNHDPDPQPRYDLVDSNRHGTRCAGEVAAVSNNTICAVGVAYGSGIGGVRMLDGDVTDAVEARSLSLNNQHIDIYSASWGPDDDGKTVDGPGELATRAFRDGIEKGRRGLGSIFVWASGNGGREKDNCNCDGYTNSIWTLSISSATENGLVPWYSEACSSTLASTYSSGSSGEKQIITTDLHHSCTSSHTGTSASAPLAAGICALALEANRKLTWRDMQHIVVRTAKPANLNARDWQTNKVGRNVSHSFGYGLMDAHAMVILAKKWRTVPPQKMCTVRAQPLDKLIPAMSHVELTLSVNCDNVRFLEHVQAKVSLAASRRGDIHIYLTSPGGTRSTLLAQRPLDNSRSGFQAWPFMTVHSWGESPNGVWKLEIHNDGRYFGKATLKEWSLILYGTTEDPDGQISYKDGASTATSSSSTTTTTTNAPLTTRTTTRATPPPPPPPPSRFPPLRNMTPPPPKDPSENDWPHILGPECFPPLYLLANNCVDHCPEGYFATRSPSHLGDTSDTTRNPQVCLRCHYTCQACSGPNDYQCISCHGDADLVDNFCQPRVLLAKLANSTVWYKTMTVAFMTLCVVIVILVGLIILTRTTFSPCCNRETQYSGLPVHTQTTGNYKDGRNRIQVNSYCDKEQGKLNVRPYHDTDDEA